MEKDLHRLFNVEVTEEDPYKNDALDRKSYAEAIESLIQAYQGGIVIAINGEWGSGKSVFLDMLSKDLSYRKEKPYCTASLNAWQHEYFNDPTLAMLSCIQSILPEENESHVKVASLLKNVNDCAKHVCQSMVFYIADRLSFGIINKDCVKDASSIIQNNNETGYLYEANAIEEYKAQINSLNIFREALTNYINEIYNATHRPVVIFIDELDRCNPSYAVALLERIKHIFAIPHVVFVIATDNEQLCNSVRGYFGSDRINAHEYLRRFFDVEISMPRINSSNFLQCCVKKMKLVEDGFIREDYSVKMGDALSMIMTHQELSLRQIEKLLTVIALGFNIVRSDQTSFNFLIPLAFSRCFDSTFFNKMYQRKATMQEVYEKFYPIYTKGKIKSPNHFVALLFMYQDYCSEYGQPQMAMRCVDENNKFCMSKEFSDNIISEAKSIRSCSDLSKLFHALNLYMDLVR